jgi:hypothetical protein
MAFFHEKELRAYCNELRRDHKRATKKLERVYGDNTEAETKAFREVDRIEKQMSRLERIMEFPRA